MNRTVPQDKTRWTSRLETVARYLAELEQGGVRREDINWPKRLGAVSRYVADLELCLAEARGIIAGQKAEIAALKSKAGCPCFRREARDEKH
jgi:hypothetical protein